MALGVILNRVFRTDNNPLFEYVYQNMEDIDQCYYIIPKEDFGNEAKMKRNYYYGTLQNLFMRSMKTIFNHFNGL